MLVSCESKNPDPLVMSEEQVVSGTSRTSSLSSEGRVSRSLMVASIAMATQTFWPWLMGTLICDP